MSRPPGHPHHWPAPWGLSCRPWVGPLRPIRPRRSASKEPKHAQARGRQTTILRGRWVHTGPGCSWPPSEGGVSSGTRRSRAGLVEAAWAPAPLAGSLGRWGGREEARAGRAVKRMRECGAGMGGGAQGVPGWASGLPGAGGPREGIGVRWGETLIPFPGWRRGPGVPSRRDGDGGGESSASRVSKGPSTCSGASSSDPTGRPNTERKPSRSEA